MFRSVLFLWLMVAPMCLANPTFESFHDDDDDILQEVTLPSG
jgi:hypothetical protein